MRKILFSLSVILVAALAVKFGMAANVAAPSTGVTVGKAAPQFKLLDQNGVDVSLATYAGKVIVLEWVNPECPFVQFQYQHHTMVNLAAKYKDKGVVWISINSARDDTNAINKTWATEQAVTYPVLNDASGGTGHAYGATNTPGMVVIGKDGMLLYRGAIDSDPNEDGKPTTINYVDQALSEVLAAKPVSVPETKQYGCSVKYAE